MMEDIVKIDSKRVKTTHSFNGKEYDGVEDLPENIRRALRDENSDGIPDILENTKVTTRIDINGKSYSGWNEVPVEYQHLRQDVDSRLGGAVTFSDSKTGRILSSSQGIVTLVQVGMFILLAILIVIYLIK